ncbi:tyrosine-type recombinase/integrase [Nocardioides rubriscoriae]|uniref:tyrosine-type recombinase/integrase n=1 Tax=Nocardioides rubriscoriae TaxID=642762 RepID=UPI0011DF3F08|nr:tyrosine-type recombinase/integrase [Nocardioides rubriscoriae]
MGRPRLTLGTSGRIAVTPQVVSDTGRWETAPVGTKAQRWKARTKFRDSDGTVRDVTKFGTTRAKAETALKAALVDRQAPAKAVGLRPEMTLAAAGEWWLERIERPGGKLSPNTIKQYRSSFERLVLSSSIADLSLREVNRVPVLERYLQTVADGHGKGSAKTARSVVSSILTLGVRHDVLDGNRMRDVENPAVAPRETTRDADRAFTLAELSHVLKVTREHQTAKDYDLVDLVHFLAGTGARHSEALNVRWADLCLVDADGGSLDVGVVRIWGTKTTGADRRVPMPAWLTSRLQVRSERYGTDGFVFHTPGRWDSASRETVRDRRNVGRHLRRVLDDAGMPWASANTFRTTVGDLVTKTLSGTEAANVLGHARPSMTYDRYSDRRQPAAGASIVLAGVMGVAPMDILGE